MAGKRETHTPGPYTDDLRGAHFVICGGCTEVMAVIPEPDLDGFGCVSADERGANMKRIKVTLNACQDIGNRQLEDWTTKGGVVEIVAEKMANEARADAAEALLAHLVAACTTEAPTIGKIPPGVRMPEKAIVEAARAFLDKENGG